MKNIILTATLGALVMGSMSFAQAQDLPPSKVSVVGTWANLSIYKEREQPFWAETIPEKSNGAIQTEVRAFTEMGLKGGEVFRLMSDGVIEFGSTVLGYVAGDDPENEAVDLAGFSPNIERAFGVSEAWKPKLAELYATKHNIKLLALYPFHAQMIYCKSEIKSLDDLKGKKVRTFSKSLSEFVEAAGGVGVNIPFAEVVPALQKGVADCAITGALSGNLAKWYEVTNYLYELPVGWSMVMHGVNMDKWNSLSPETQTFLEREISAWEKQVWASAEGETKLGISCNTGTMCGSGGNSANMQLVPVTAEDTERLRQIMERVVVRNWAKRCGEECVADWNETVGTLVNMTVSATE